MTSLDDSDALKVQTTTGTDTPSATDASSLTGMPSVAEAPSTTNKPSAAKTSALTDEQTITLTSSTAAMTLEDASQSLSTEPTSPRWHRAAHAVLSTNELLCNIFARLPLKDIVAATGICKAWRNAIAADPGVQQALFLKPVEISEVLVEDRMLLALHDLEPINIDKCTVVGQLHPFAEKFCSSIKFRAAQSHALPLPRDRWRGCHTETVSIFGHDHPDGTWREMFLTQPPCLRVRVEIYKLSCAVYGTFGARLRDDETYVEDLNFGFSLENESGVKLGELYEHIVTTCPWTGYSVRSTIRKYITKQIGGSDRTKCTVRNGKVCRPEQLPDSASTGCDAFGIPPYHTVTRGSWSCYHYTDDSSQNGDSEQEGDGEREGTDDDAEDEDEGKEEEVDDDEDEWWTPRLLPPRVNAFMFSRAPTYGDGSDSDGDDEAE
jgi:hypothetical protein